MFKMLIISTFLLAISLPVMSAPASGLLDGTLNNVHVIDHISALNTNTNSDPTSEYRGQAQPLGSSGFVSGCKPTLKRSEILLIYVASDIDLLESDSTEETDTAKISSGSISKDTPTDEPGIRGLMVLLSKEI
ncbi:hypothetical protein BDQ12DRAFT_664800 [Crucibulum laeve]|uniref:Uncharacterized protein n=1 Tax=Crucibulum laeve TaxID=68775 RepID=A0A5C3M4G9_9AGAR|nr:hypothetical protein BDQ12DRAFT_664800 [Crucibulum laeve]